jgi:hypothetical protein
MGTELIVSCEIDGLHHWPDAPEKYKEFRNPHRHLFKLVGFLPMGSSTDPIRREKELWELRSELIEMIYRIWGTEGCVKEEMLDFGPMSCEGIADVIKEKMNFSKVFVGEEYWLGALVS